MATWVHEDMGPQAHVDVGLEPHFGISNQFVAFWSQGTISNVLPRNTSSLSRQP